MFEYILSGENPTIMSYRYHLSNWWSRLNARPIDYPSPSPQPYRLRVKTQLGFATFNAASLMSKIYELINLASLKYIDVESVTETWLHDEITNQEISLPGLIPFCQDHSFGKRGEQCPLCEIKPPTATHDTTRPHSLRTVC